MGKKPGNSKALWEMELNVKHREEGGNQAVFVRAARGSVCFLRVCVCARFHVGPPHTHPQLVTGGATRSRAKLQDTLHTIAHAEERYLATRAHSTITHTHTRVFTFVLSLIRIHTHTPLAVTSSPTYPAARRLSTPVTTSPEQK